MFTERIIPCLDVKEGKVVKGVNFVGLKEVGDPVALARRYYEQGADEIVFLDISATNEGRKTMADVARQVAKEIFIPFTIGGGIRSIDDITTLLRSGADKVSLNSAAIHDPQLIRKGAGDLWQSVHRCCDRCPKAVRWQRLERLHQWRPQRYRHRSDRLGAAGDRTGRRRDPFDQHGCGRYPQWL